MSTENELFSAVDALLEQVAQDDLPVPAERKRLREAAGLSQAQIATALNARREAGAPGSACRWPGAWPARRAATSHWPMPPARWAEPGSWSRSPRARQPVRPSRAASSTAAWEFRGQYAT
ncbi:hypothetical protein [Streptomyces sp. NBC_01643]|uniref:hypothetical protein n=1 Tax=Streptomyces sp. NBC_01643 TaxID=2975906 RepID=UPI003864A447|nr:hypothetical protein OHB03_30575 [Streptomyces sp. NBC_01643]